MYNDSIHKAIKALKNLKDAKSTLANIHIFLTDTDVPTLERKEIFEEFYKNHNNLLKYPWHLPFKTCALIYNDGSTILFVPEKKALNNNKNWYFTVRDNFDTESPRALQGSFTITPGGDITLPAITKFEPLNIISPLGHDENTCLNLASSLEILVHNNKMYSVKNSFKTDLQQDILELYELFLHGVTYIAKFSTEPKFFVVEMRNITKKKNKTLISNNAFYKIMHITDIRKNYIRATETSENPIRKGYERRAHLRTYRHERYVNVKGKTVIIESTWIGPTETTIDNKIYKVKVNLH